MKKTITCLLIAFTSMRISAQPEMAMNDLGHQISPVGASNVIKTSALPANVYEMMHINTKPILNIQSPQFFPLSIQEIKKPDFGSEFSVFADTVTGNRIIDLKREVNELMIFAKNSEGELVMTQLLHMVDRVEIDIPGPRGINCLEMLTREGDKTTLYLD